MRSIMYELLPVSHLALTRQADLAALPAPNDSAEFSEDVNDVSVLVHFSE